MLRHTPLLSALSLLLEPDCPAGGTVCTAGRILPWLYAAAAVLGLVLVLVVILAVRIWRKNKNEDFER